MTYLKMPLQLQSAVAKKLQRCSYQESIAQHIMLLILSHHGEVIGREDFGSMIWGSYRARRFWFHDMGP